MKTKDDGSACLSGLGDGRTRAILSRSRRRHGDSVIEVVKGYRATAAGSSGSVVLNFNNRNGHSTGTVRFSAAPCSA